MPDIHLEIGTSSVHRLINCPASLPRSKKAPRGKSSSAATEGTLLHTVMENIYEHEQTAEEQVGAVEYEGVVFTKDMLTERIAPAVTATEKLLDMVDADELINEQFVEYIEGKAGGTLDMIAVSSDEKTVLLNDYKFGYNRVDPENNSQILMAALSASTDPKTARVFRKAEKFIGAITQPKVFGDNSPTWEFTLADIDAFEAKLVEAIELSNEENPPAATGSHCQYCAAAPFCSEKKLVARSAKVLPMEDAKQIAAALALAEELEPWIKDVKKLAHDMLDKGGRVPGYKLVQKRASRVWTDPEAVEDKIRKAKKIKLEQGFTMNLKSPAQIEKLCKELKVPFDPYKAMQASVSSGTTMAPESDKRPAVAQKVVPDTLKALMGDK